MNPVAAIRQILGYGKAIAIGYEEIALVFLRGIITACRSQIDLELGALLRLLDQTFSTGGLDFIIRYRGRLLYFIQNRLSLRKFFRLSRHFRFGIQGIVHHDRVRLDFLRLTFDFV